MLIVKCPGSLRVGQPKHVRAQPAAIRVLRRHSLHSDFLANSPPDRNKSNRLAYSENLLPRPQTVRRRPALGR